MAIYHLEAKVVSRGAGRSAVAASAYMSCSRLYNDYDGIQHDYTKKQGLSLSKELEGVFLWVYSKKIFHFLNSCIYGLLNSRNILAFSYFA